MTAIRQQLIRAEDFIKRNQKKAAQGILQTLLSQPIEQADDLYFTGMIALNLDLFAAAAQLLRQAIHKDPNQPHYYNSCGFALMQAYQYTAAEQFILKSIQMSPSSVDYQTSLGDLYQNSGQYAAAEKTFKQSLVLNPHAVEALYALASLYERKFSNKQAKQYARHALKVDANHAPSHFILCQIYHREKRLNEAVIELKKLLTRHPNYIPALYELGHILHKQQKFPEAHATFDRANTQQDPGYLNAEQMQREFESLTKIIDNIPQQCIDDIPRGNATLTPSPVFIVGSPRSGTTLLSSMLGQHSQLYAAGELSSISELYTLVNQKLGHLDNEGEIINHLWGEQGQAFTAPLIEHYQSLLKQVPHVPPNHRIIDKTPFNVQRFPMMAKVCPNSPIIHIIRDGREVSWSNYTQNYNQYHWHAHSLTCGILTWQRNILTARQCAAKFHLNYIEIRYEDLVQHPERTLKTALEHLNLPWEKSCLTDYKESNAPILTASYAQVKQDLYTSSLQKAKNYSASYAAMTQHVYHMLNELGYATAC